MRYNLYKLSFSAPVHIGSGRLSDGENFICADTLFSALCSRNPDLIEELATKAKTGELVFTDCLPFIGDTLYIPKPLLQISKETEGDSSQKKLFKKLTFIPVDKLQNYLSGNLDPRERTKKFENLGKFSLRDMMTLPRSDTREEDPTPFSVGTYRFSEGCGLYVVAGFEADGAKGVFDNAISALGYVGIGGKRSSGLGKFSVTVQEVPSYLESLLSRKGDTYITLSVSMAKDGELEKALEGAKYLLQKRSGFVRSFEYSDTPLKKNDFYSFKSGSCFKEKFEGDVFDVSNNGAHPVYRYAKPFFLEVKNV